VCTHTPADADAVVVGGNGFRAVGAIAALEHTLERPVLTANQALLWAALNAAGADPSAIFGYGRIFQTTTTEDIRDRRGPSAVATPAAESSVN
jgi:maleate isomerase